MKAYNIYKKSEPSTILFHAIVDNVNDIFDLAKEENIDLFGMEFELQGNVGKNQFGKYPKPSIKDALVY